MRSVFVFLVFAFPVYSAASSPFLDALRFLAEGKPFVIAVDYDGTMVETDVWLIDFVLPAAVERFLPEVPLEQRSRFTSWLEYLKERGPVALPAYDEAAWARDSAFPAQHLPDSLKHRVPLHRSASAILGFWDLVQEVFEEQSGRGFPFVPEFLEFFGSVNQAFGPEVQWVVVTARSPRALEDVKVSLKHLDCAHAISILSGNPDFTLYPQQSAALKGDQISRFQSVSGLEVFAVLDNDARVLKEVKSKVSKPLLLLHMLPKGSALPRLHQVPAD